MSLTGLAKTLVLPQRNVIYQARANSVNTALKWLHIRLLLISLAVFLAACSKPSALDDTVNDLVFKTLTGEQIAMHGRSGPVLVNFWSTDCAVCIREMPELTELYHDYHAKGFEMIAVAMPFDAPNRVLEMAEQQDWPFPVALDVRGDALASFATVKGTPTSYLIDTEGKLIKRYVGAISMDHIRKQLDSLLGLG